MAAEQIWTRQARWIGGRRVLSGEIPYFFEKDKREIDRLNQQHFLLKSVCGGKNYFVPVKHPRRILDVASGTGIWGRELAQHFRQATVWNVDKDEAVNAQGTRVLSLPTNFRFKRWEYPAPLPFEDAFFDYVHARFLTLFVPAERWPALIVDMLRVVRPGGWVGMLEAGWHQSHSPSLLRLQSAAKEMLARYGLEANPGPHLETWARAACPVTFTRKQVQVSTANPSQRLALIDNVCDSAKNAASNLIQAGFFSRDEMDALLDDLPLELRTLGVSIPYYAVFGQKPN